MSTERVSYAHFRFNEGEDLEPIPAPRGGFTIAFVYDEATNKTLFSRADCSDYDNFSYNIGRNIALGRLKNARPAEYDGTPAELLNELEVEAYEQGFYRHRRSFIQQTLH